MPTLAQQLTALPLFPIQERNELVDRCFYDINALTAEEKASCSLLRDRGGTLLVVPPREQTHRKILNYSSGLRFINHGSHDISRESSAEIPILAHSSF